MADNLQDGQEKRYLQARQSEIKGYSLQCQEIQYNLSKITQIQLSTPTHDVYETLRFIKVQLSLMEIASYAYDNIEINNMMNQVQLIQDSCTKMNQNYEDVIDMIKSLNLYIQHYIEKINNEYFQIQKTLEETFRMQKTESFPNQNSQDFQEEKPGESKFQNVIAKMQGARTSVNQDFNIRNSQEHKVENYNKKIAIAGGMRMFCKSENASYDKSFKNRLKNNKYLVKINNIGFKEISQLMDGYRHSIRLGAYSLSSGEIKIPKLITALSNLCIKLPGKELSKKADSQVDFIDQWATKLTDFVKRRQLVYTADFNSAIYYHLNCAEEHNLIKRDSENIQIINPMLFKRKINFTNCNYAFSLIKNLTCHKNPTRVKKYFLDYQNNSSPPSNHNNFLLQISYCKLKPVFKDEISENHKNVEFHTSPSTLAESVKIQQIIKKKSTNYQSTQKYGLHNPQISKIVFSCINIYFAVKNIANKIVNNIYKYMFLLKMKGFKFSL